MKILNFKINKIRATEAGFTLLEVLIALTILAIGLLMLAGFQITAIKANGIGYKMSAGAVLTEDALESLKNKVSISRIDSSLSVGTHTAATDPTIIPVVTANGLIYTRTYTVVNNTNFLTVTMTTQWVDNGNHSVNMTIFF